MGLGKILEDTCKQYAGNIALIHNDKKLTYGELDRAVNSLGNRLSDLGIKKGDSVALMLPNIPEFVISYFAIQKIGAVAVTLNVMSTPYELHYLLENSDSKAFITTSPSVKKFEDVKDKLPLCRHLIVADSPDFKEAVGEGPFELEMPEIEGDDPAVMIYSSGLTGKPLGAVLTHNNLSTQSSLLGDICDGSENDRGLCIIPLFHSFGAVANMLGTIKIGASMVMMERFTIESIFKIIERERVTYIAAVPRLFLAMLLYDGVENYDLSSLRLCITGGATMPPDYIPIFKKTFGVKLMEGYGLTEASPVCSFSRLNMEQKPESTGVAIPDVEVKVLDDEENELPAGQIGELVVKGANVMKGYYKDEEATAKVIKNGWLYTGDLARIDEDGYIFLMGLKKKLIITSGLNVYPREVEIALNMHPAVGSSKIIGKPDLMRGEIVKALIVKNGGTVVDEKEILKHCRTYLSPYKVPREVEFVESLLIH
ncbi:MAG: AMP-binding protein [Proteobacteria bacterium]|nr:AMP-binding protein [Pseudomonadota bacterium]